MNHKSAIMKEKIKIGIIRETKTPPDRRVPLTPSAARELIEKFPNLEITVQPSELRSFKNNEYTREGFHLQENLSDCDFLMGVKEVKVQALIPEKTYLFFAHVAKKQSYNCDLLQEVLNQGITLIDYEYITRQNGSRVVAFGHWAGVVGAYNGLRAYGRRSGDFMLKPAHEFEDMETMYEDLRQQQLKPMKILITGGGRVAHGAMQTLEQLNIKQVSPGEFLNETFNEPVVARIDPWHYVKRKDGSEFNLQHFFNYPSEYESTFKPYTKVTDLFITAHFWHPESPVFITRKDMQEEDFRMKVIADASCDIKGPIASTVRASTIASPFYDYNPATGKEEKPFSSERHVTVMAVDNLPGELPRDASENFARMLIDNVIPNLIGEDTGGMITRGTIAKNGRLTPAYAYLQDYANGRE